MTICSNNVTLNVKAGLSRFIIIVITLLHFQIAGYAQNSASADSLVRLVEARSAHLIEVDGTSYRKIVGPATFLHNNTYLKCDTALWNVNTNIIDALGNVEILQENTRLTSDRIEYVADENLAKFRGSLVQLSDRDGNILNTNFLNYNTNADDAIVAANPGVKMHFVNFNGAKFNRTGEFAYEMEDGVAAYKVVDGALVAIPGCEYDVSEDAFVFNTRTLGSYVFADAELVNPVVAAPEVAPEVINPTTGA